jgi:hypothetical protein
MASGACLLVPACVDPKNDYDDYLSRTAAERAAAGGDDGGTADAAAPDAGFSGQYVMACVSAPTGDSLADALFFVATVQYTPSPAGGGGTLTYSNAPLQVGATNISQTVAPVNTVGPVPVGTDGTATVDFGAVTIPASADPLGSDVVFTDSRLDFLISTADGSVQFCAGEAGSITAPFDTTFDKKTNPCVFKPASSSSFPTFVQSDFHCF